MKALRGAMDGGSHGAIWLALLLAACLGAGGPEKCGAAFPHPEAPRLLNYYLCDDFIGNESFLARWDLVVLSFKHLDLSAESLALLRQHNPDIRILAYIDPMCISRIVQGTPGNLHYDFHAGIDSLWMAYSAEGDTVVYWQDTYAVNITERCPLVGGLQYRDYFTHFVRERLAPYAIDGLVDGIFLDEMSNGGYLWQQDQCDCCYDYDLDHVCDSTDSLRVWYTHAIGFFADSTAGALPAGGLVLANNCKPYQPAANGRLFECFPASWDGNLAGCLNAIDYWSGHGPQPRITAVNGIPETPGNMRQFRYRYTGSLLGDCYFNYDYDSGNHHQTDWFELFDFELGLPRGPRHTLNESPILLADFETGPNSGVIEVPYMSHCEITTDPALVLQGQRSWLCDVIIEDPWPALFEVRLPNGFLGSTWYTFSFLYRIVSCLPDGSDLFMKAQQSASCQPLMSVFIPVVQGEQGLFRVSFRLDACNDYRLYLRSREETTVVVDSLAVIQGRPGLWARDYENGVVVCNDSGYFALTLPYDPDWELVDGDQQHEHYPLWLSGQSIIIPNRDGLVFRYAAHGQPCLNEFLAINGASGQDEAGDYDSWLELYNRGAASAELGGLFLSNDLEDGTRWPLPDLILDPGAFTLVWCDDEASEGPLHANFDLSPEGGMLALFDRLDAGNVLLDSCSYGPQIADTSRGRVPDGGGAWRYCTPSPGEANDIITGAAPARSAALRLLSCRPNPFRAATTFRFATAQQGLVRLEIFDLSGRFVARLLDEGLPAGEHRAIWTGRDAAGRRAPSGLYVCRLLAAGQERSQRLLLLR